MSRKLAAQEEPVINLTPLIDVVFVVLIMFIFIAPLLEQEGVSLAPGGSEHKSVDKMSPIAIYIQKNGTISINQQKVSEEQLIEVLTKLKKAHPLVTPQLYCDQAARFGLYQLVKNGAEKAGFEQIDVILKPS